MPTYEIDPRPPDKPAKRPEKVKFKVVGETFECLPNIPAGYVTDVLEAFETLGREDAGLESAQAVRYLAKFVSQMLADDAGRARWEKLQRDPKRFVTFAQVAEVFTRLVEHYIGSGAPFPSSSVRGSGAGSTSSTSGDDSSSPVVATSGDVTY